MDRNSSIGLVDHRHARSAAAISAQVVQVVSFDVFDTLIHRNAFEPKDIFSRVSKHRTLVSHPLTSRFAMLRAKAERDLRLRFKAQGKQIDPTLSQIYEELAVLSGESLESVYKFRDVELQTELASALSRNPIKSLYDYAQALGKIIVLCSDMYLPRATIEAMLNKCGYTGPHELFLSCEIGVTKKHGTVFDHIASALDVAPSAIVHFGDNAISDVKRAEAAGWKAMKTPSLQELFFAQNEALIGLFPTFKSAGQIKSEATRQNYALLWRYIFGDQVDAEGNADCIGSPRGFGYVALGPFLLSLSLWMLRQAKQKNIDHIAFLARDGHLPIQSTRMLAEALNQDIALTYLPISRRAVFPYFLHQPGGIEYILSIRYDPRQTIGRFLRERFGQTAFDIFVDAAKSTSGLEPESFIKDHSDFVFDLMRTNLETLRDATAQQYQFLLKSYRESFPAGQKHALFDVGRKGTFQSVLSTISGEGLHGFYVVTDFEIQKNAPKRTYDSYLGMMDSRLNSKVPDTVLYEAFLSEKGGTYLGFDEAGQPVRDSASFTVDEQAFFDELHAGALEYIRDAIARFKQDVDDLEQEGFYASYALEHWPENASAVRLLQDICHEDSVSSPESKSLYDYFINPTRTDAQTLFPVRTERKRIMIYAPAITRVKGGAERIAARLANHLCETGYEVLVFSSGKENESIRSVYDLSPGVLVRNVNVNDLDRLSKLISSYNPDCGIVLASGPLIANIGRAFLKHEIPFMLSERASPSHSRKTYWKNFTEGDYFAVYEAATTAAVQFESYREEFPSHMRNRVSVISNPILTTTKRRTKRDKLIVCAARIWFEQKRQDVLMEAFGKVAERYPDWSLAFYGSTYGNDRKSLNELAKKLGVSDRVTISDPIESIHKEFERASIFVLPSAFEGFPNALAEALAAGAPSIGFAGCPGTNELIENNKNGLLVDDRDLQKLLSENSNGRKVSARLQSEQLVNRLAAALEQLMSNSSLRSDYSKAAFESMRRYDADRINKYWETEIASLIERDGAEFKTQREQFLSQISDRLNAAARGGAGGADAYGASRLGAPALDAEYRIDWQSALRIARSRPPSIVGRIKLALKKRSLQLTEKDRLDIALAPIGSIVLPPPPTFNERGYLTFNPDVEEAVRRGEIQSGYVHYLLHGHAEGRPRPTTGD
jgi:glycosyltransferase involved in cell wall biosynthesis/FMN phosphatase YigB (HAD superfamily)